MKKTLGYLSLATFILGALFFGSTLVAKNELMSFNPKIGKSVYYLLEKSGRSFTKAGIPVLVIMKETADLSTVDATLAKEVKGQQVYQLLTTTANTSQTAIRAFLTEKNVKFRPFWIVNMVVLEKADTALISELAAREDVASIVGDPSISTPPLPLEGMLEVRLPETFRKKGPKLAAGDNIVSTNATAVWEQYGTRGTGIVVAGQDTGVDYTHPALLPHYRGFTSDDVITHDYNWHDAFPTKLPETSKNKCGYALAQPCDDDEHGTHTMGTMVGDDGKGNIVGMAPDAKWIACRNMDAGTGTPSSYLDCFQFFLAPTPIGGDAFTDGDATKAPHVINNSWGCPESEGCEGSEMVPALKAMEAAGIFVVVSAGNDGPNCSTINSQPATITANTLSVGAYNHKSKAMASFSSRGPSKLDGGVGPDVVAPGVNIRSSIPGGTYTGSMWSGTSMAGPHVAGQVALLWSAVPELIGHIQMTSEIITSTARPTTVSQSCGEVSGSIVPNNTAGYGFIDVLAAVKMAKELYN